MPGALQPPRLLQQVELPYPGAAEKTGEHGDVGLLVDVDATGAVVGVRIESGPEVFHEAALAAASLAACGGGGDVGEECETNDDCEDGLECHHHEHEEEGEEEGEHEEEEHGECAKPEAEVA